MDICKHSEFCGGCAYQGVPYEEQLRNKEGELRGLLEQNRVDYGELLPVRPSPSRYAYRNKMEYSFGDFEKGGTMTLGMHRKRHFWSIVTADACQIVPEDFNQILRAVLRYTQSAGHLHYHKKSHQGFLRHLVLRCGVRTGEILVNLVTTSQETLDAAAFVDMLFALPLESKIVGVLHTINDRPADAVYCDELRVLYGRAYYEESLLGLRFRVSAFSFFQTNVEAVENLYDYAINLLDDFAGKSVFDLFCGTGTITQLLARKAARVTGIEIVEEAVRAAEENAELNGLNNCRFLAGDVFEVLDRLPDIPDILVVDPPRAGIAPKALDKIISYAVPEILYISCNPKSLASNLAYLQYYGYRARCIQPFDNFPMTKHVECVVLMSRVEK